MSSIDSPKVAEANKDSRIVATFEKGQKYLSISGHSETVKDQAKINQIWKGAWKAWFPGGKHSIIAVNFRNLTPFKVKLTPTCACCVSAQKKQSTGTTRAPRASSTPWDTWPHSLRVPPSRTRSDTTPTDTPSWTFKAKLCFPQPDLIHRDYDCS